MIGLLSCLGNIWKWLTQVVSNIIQWGQDVIEKAKTAVSTMFNNTVNWFKKLPRRNMELVNKNSNEYLQLGSRDERQSC